MTQLQHLSIWTGYDDLASAKGWQRVQVQGRAAVQSSDAPFPSWVEAAAGSAPFYDALEGHWRVLLPRGGGAHGNASAPLMTLIAAEIAGPYGNVNVDTTGGHRAPALSEVGAGSSSSGRINIVHVVGTMQMMRLFLILVILLILLLLLQTIHR